MVWPSPFFCFSRQKEAERNSRKDFLEIWKKEKILIQKSVFEKSSFILILSSKREDKYLVYERNFNMNSENNQELISAIEDVVDTATYMRNAYFFTPPQTSSARRWYEEKHSAEFVKWEESGNVYTAEFITECSCRHVYTKGYYTKNGKETTLKAIKNSLNRLKAND